MSPDGFITGPNPRPGAPLGDSGERLHDWMSGITDLRESHRTPSRAADADARVIDNAYSGIGALVMGRSMFDAGEGPWGKNPPFGMPVFIVTHRARKTIISREAPTSFSSTARPGWSTSSRFTSSDCSWATEFAYSSIPAV